MGHPLRVSSYTEWLRYWQQQQRCCSVHLLSHPQVQQRHELLKEMQLLLQPDHRATAACYSLPQDLAAIAQQLTPALLETRQLLRIDALHQAAAPQQRLLVTLLKQRPAGVKVIIGAAQEQQLARLAEQLNEPSILVDCSKGLTRPCLRALLQRQAEKAGKQLTEEAWDYLLSRPAPPPIAALRTQLAQAISYSGAATTIARSQLQAIIARPTLLPSWPAAAAIVWQRRYVALETPPLPALLQRIPPLRYHLELGLQLKTLPAGSVMEQSRQRLASYRQQAQALTTRYFSTGLRALLALELQAKSTAHSPHLLFDCFCSRLFAANSATTRCARHVRGSPAASDSDR